MKKTTDPIILVSVWNEQTERYILLVLLQLRSNHLHQLKSSSNSSSSFRQITYNRRPPSLDWRAVSSGCDLLQPVRTVMSLIVSTVWCCLCIVFVASRIFAFLQRTLLLLFSLSGSRDLCIGVHSMSVCVCGRAQVIRALFPVLVKYYCQFVFPSS